MVENLRMPGLPPVEEMKDEVVLAEVHDAFGVIRVVEIGEYRFLEFGAVSYTHLTLPTKA